MAVAVGLTSTALSLLWLAVVLPTHVDSHRYWNRMRDAPIFDTLKVNAYTHTVMPRSEIEAVKGGWTLISKRGGRYEVKSLFPGSRYIKDGDYALVLIFSPSFDDNGYIFGVQAGIPEAAFEAGYPRATSTVRNYFQVEGGYAFLTAYFSDPSLSCRRTSRDFYMEGTGRSIYIQNGSNPRTDYLQIPGIDVSTFTSPFIHESCVLGKGDHYWFGVSAGRTYRCEEIPPFLILFSLGSVHGVEWVMCVDHNRTSSPWLEVAHSANIKFVFGVVPARELYFQHVYTRSVADNNYLCNP